MSDVRVALRTPNFFELYSRGDVSPDDIDGYIDRWHDTFAGASEFPPLHEYLGLTREEYEVWLYDPSALPFIRRARQPGEGLAVIMAQRHAQLCAGNRREDGAIIVSLDNWLKRQQAR